MKADLSVRLMGVARMCRRVIHLTSCYIFSSIVYCTLPYLPDSDFSLCGLILFPHSHTVALVQSRVTCKAPSATYPGVGRGTNYA